MQKLSSQKNRWKKFGLLQGGFTGRWKIAKFWLNFVLVTLLVNFGGPAGGDSTWRLETPPCDRETSTWLVETV